MINKFDSKFKGDDYEDRKSFPWVAHIEDQTFARREDTGNYFPTDRPGYNTDHWMLFCGIFLFASLGGLAALLRSGQNISWTQILSAVLNSGIMGLIVAMVLWNRFAGEDIYLLIGVSVMSGFGGSTIIDFSYKILKLKAKRFFGVENDIED